MNNTRYYIPFVALKDTLKVYQEDHNRFMQEPFVFLIHDKGLDHKFSLTRRALSVADGNGDVLLTSVLSDCAMELLATKVKFIIENSNELTYETTKFRTPEELLLFDRPYCVIYQIACNILRTEFGVVTLSKLEHQTIETATECFDTENIDYVRFVCKLPAALIKDGNDAVVCDANHNFRATKMKYLVCKY